MLGRIVSVTALALPLPLAGLPSRANSRPAGNTGCLTVDLEPDRCARVSEWYGERGMVKTFTVE